MTLAQNDEVAEASGEPESELADAAYHQAVIDLLGVLAYGELTSCARMAADSELAPTLDLRARMVALAVSEYQQFENASARLRELGVDPEVAMEPFVAAFSAFHDRTRPRTWIEGLIKAYVGDGIAKDLYREMAAFVDAQTREVIEIVLDDARTGELVVSVVRSAIATDDTARSRLSLWARRLMGEALSQGQTVAGQRDALASLLVGGADLAAIGQIFARLTSRHEARMAELGLSA